MSMLVNSPTSENFDLAVIYGKPGLYEGLPMERYHAGAGVSRSDLLLADKSPAHYFAWKLDPKRPAPPERKGWLEGNLFHTALFEPAEFTKRYVVLPEDAPSRPTSAQWNAAKPSPKSVADMAWWTDFGERNAGKTAISQAQSDVAERQRDSAMRIREVADLMKAGTAEVSAYAKDSKHTSITRRVRADWVTPAGSNGLILLDGKTCDDASTDGFSRQIARKQYEVQDAYYSDTFALASGMQVLSFLFLPVESSYPYAANLIELDPESRAQGRARYMRAMERLAECLGSGNWTGYGDGVKLTSLPKWAMQDIGE